MSRIPPPRFDDAMELEEPSPPTNPFPSRASSVVKVEEVSTLSASTSAKLQRLHFDVRQPSSFILNQTYPPSRTEISSFSVDLLPSNERSQLPPRRPLLASPRSVRSDQNSFVLTKSEVPDFLCPGHS